MIKVTIEATGEKKQVLTGDMVNAVITTEKGCELVCAANSKNRVKPGVFIRSLVALVNTAIKSYSFDDISYELLNTLFAIEMRSKAKKAQQAYKEDTAKSEDEAFKRLMKILGKAVEE